MRVTNAARRAVLVLAMVVVGSVVVGAPSTASALAPKAQPSTPQPGPLATTGTQRANMPRLDNGFGPTPAQKQAMARAATTARTGKKPVVVDGLTTETQQVTAQPGGGFTLAANPQPVRTPQHGAWVPVDTTLHRNPDGTLSPAATAYGTVTLSGGGARPLATTTSGATSYAVSWPSTLPTPTVTGATATYPNVLPGVDLQVSANVAGGFSDVLVVHTPQAAHNPALATLSLAGAVTGGHLAAGPHGGITLTGTPGGNTLDAATPLMWDSNTTPTAATGKNAPRIPAGTAVGVDPSDAAHPGLAAHLGVVQARVHGSTVDLVPDPQLLTGRATVYPLYIDPSFQWHPTTGGTPAFDEVKQGAPCTNTSFYNNSGSFGDFGDLGVGVNAWTSCFGIMRSYYQWQIPSVIWGAHIGNAGAAKGAEVDATEDYSAVCSTPSTTVNLHWAGGIGPGTTWNNQPGYGPSIAQANYPPSKNPTFCPGNPPVSRAFDVTGVIAQIAAGHGNQFTVALTEDANEATRSSAGFSRFQHNPTLQISYNLIPNTPGPAQMAAVSGTDNAGCATSPPYPYMGKTLATNTPVLNAGISDPDSDLVQGNYQYWIDGSTTRNSGTSADNLASGSTAQFSLPLSFVGGLANGQVVDWQAQASDGEATSGWSPICHFIAEPTAPSAPAITSADGRYPSNGTVGALAGTPGQFTIASTGGTVSTLVQGLDQAPATSNAPAAAVAPFTGGAAITPTGRWPLTDGTGTTATDSTGAHPATLTGGATWTTDPTRGKVLSFDGASGGTATSGPVFNTAGSFSVAAWVNITAATSTSQTFVIQQGNTRDGFALEYDAGTNRWTFTRRLADSPSSGSVFAESGAAAAFNTWTHLVGEYDNATGGMTLYVNGTASGSATDTTPFPANGQLVIGHGFNNTNWAHAQISDIQTYQYVLSPDQIAAVQTGGTTTPTGRWRFLEGTGNSGADSSPNNHPVTLSGGHTWTATPVSAAAFDGTSGSAATTAPVLNTAGSFTVSAWVNVAASTGTSQTFVIQQGTHTDGFALEYDGGSNRWTFTRRTADTTNPGSIFAESGNPAAFTTWTHLAGVYDATTGSMTLYVNGTASGSATDTTPFATTGPLVIGRGFTGNWAHAAISDVQTYQSALDASEVAELHAAATLGITPPSPGPHTLYSYATDPAGDVSGYQAYPFLAGKDPSTTCASLAACFNNTAISPDNNPGLASIGGGVSFSANDLTNAGWNSGSQVTINGATFTLPQYGAGQADNVLAANQTITYNQPVPATGAAALEFLATSTNVALASPGALKDDNTAPYVPAGVGVTGTYCFDATNPAAYCPAQGTINYSDGTADPYFLTVPDWIVGPEPLAAVELPHENTPSGQLSRVAMMYPFTVPLKPGKTVTSVTLPDVSTNPNASNGALHIFGMATRDTTTNTTSTMTAATGNTVTTNTLSTGQTWTGAWATPTEGVFNYGAAFTNQTFREPVTPSLSGGEVRIKFDDALGIDALNIGHATIAVQSTAGSPVPAATPVALTFGGNHQAVTVPEGGMVYSDPLTFPVTANQTLLVSFQLTNTVTWLVAHSWPSSNGYSWTSPTGSGDSTTDTTGTPFTQTGAIFGNATFVTTGLDVITTGVATQAVLGDGFIDQANTGHVPTATTILTDNLIAAEPTTPSGYGLLAEGVESNQIMTDYPERNGSGPAALSRIDRDLLDQPNLTTVVLNQGLEDTLAGRAADDLERNGYTQLISYLQTQNINIIAIGQTPCDGYAGDGVTPNDPCTSTVDQQRTLNNTWLFDKSQPFVTPRFFYLNPDTTIGVPDTGNGETKLNPAADGGDHVNLTDAGYGALTNAYLGAQDTWPLNDGTGSTQAADAGNNATNPYLATNPLAGNNPATLAGTPTWPTDPTHGTGLGLDGTTSYATTGSQVLTTTGSFTVSAWANLSSTSHNADIISQDATTTSGFALQYDATHNQWAFTMPTTNTTNPTLVQALSGAAPTTGTWTHLVGTYNATTHILALYINGKLAGTATNTTPINATGTLAIGRGQANTTATDFFPGTLSTTAAWNYTLTPTQITALYQQIN